MEDVGQMSKIIHSKLRILLMVVLICILSLAALLIWSVTVKAETQDIAWSWTTTKPNTYSSFAVTDMDANLCSGPYQMKNIAGETDPKRVCMMSRDNVIFGTYFANGGFSSAVGFTYDGKMHKVWGACEGYNSCLYLPGSDTLATKQYLINGMVRSLVIYKNFTHRLTQFINPSTLATEYSFDTSNPDYVFKSADGYAWPIGGFGASDNGQWLAIEFRQRGIGVLDIETLQMKRVSTMAFSYGKGYDPTSELAISDDGGHVAVMGSNAGLTVFDVTSTCGDEATDDRMSSVYPIAQSCRTAQIDSSEFIYRFHNAFSPRFSVDGGELGFYAISYVGEVREVSLRAVGYETQGLDYLALGDSFSSGEGELDDSYYLNGTNDEYEKCHTSTRSYPYIIANLLSIDPNYIKSVACSGAKTTDVVGMDTLYLGQGERLGERNLNLSDSDRVLAQTWAKESFLPGRVHQESFVKKYNPGVITIGIGGNDAGLMQKLTACLGPDTCDWAGTAEGREKSAIEIKNLFDTLVQTYQTLHTVSPNSKIYAIGYPNIINPAGYCSLLTNFLLDDSEKQFLSQGVAYLNQVIAAAASAAGIKYVDVQESYGNHVICGEESPSAMNFFKLGDDISPIDQLGWLKLIGQESFHPNYLGHALVAESIIGSVGNIMAYDYCGSGVTICPDGSLAPEPSNYWIPNQYHNYPASKIADYVFDRGDALDNRQKKLIVASNSLAPGSSVSVEITSEPRPLGQFEAASDGSLTVDVDLPIDLEEGYHTVHLYGTSYSGESIELYQIIEYRKPYVEPDIPPVEEDNTTGTDDTGSTNDVDNTDGVNDTDSDDSTDGTVDTVETDDVNNQTDIVVDKELVSEVNSLITPAMNQNNDLAVVSGINSINGVEQLDESVAMMSEPMVKGASTVLRKPLTLAGLIANKKDNIISIYAVIGVFCAVVIVIAVLIIRKLKTRV